MAGEPFWRPTSASATMADRDSPPLPTSGAGSGGSGSGVGFGVGGVTTSGSGSEGFPNGVFNEGFCAVSLLTVPNVGAGIVGRVIHRLIHEGNWLPTGQPGQAVKLALVAAPLHHHQTRRDQIRFVADRDEKMEAAFDPAARGDQTPALEETPEP